MLSPRTFRIILQLWEAGETGQVRYLLRRAAGLLPAPRAPPSGSVELFEAVGMRDKYNHGWCLPSVPDMVLAVRTQFPPPPVVMVGPGVGDNERELRLLHLFARYVSLSGLSVQECHIPRRSLLTHIGRFVTKLEIRRCHIDRKLDWRFLVGSRVRELTLWCATGVDSRSLGSALAAHLATNEMDSLTLQWSSLIDEVLQEIGSGLCKLRQLDATGSPLGNSSIALVTRTLRTPGNLMRKLIMQSRSNALDAVEAHFPPALRSPHCGLVRLVMCPICRRRCLPGAEGFHERLEIFTLLQARRARSPLRRLPLEMFRLVGQMLL